MKKTIKFLGIGTIIIFIVVIGVIGFNKFRFYNNVNAPAGADSRYMINCDKISIYMNDEKIIELEGEEKDKIIKKFENNGIVDKESKALDIDDSFNILVDFNNDITRIYMREKDCYMGLKKDAKNAYLLTEDLHNYIIELIK